MKERLSLNDIQRIDLEILKKFDNLCRENNLKYSLAYGTLIGAVRHKGFIPWDDDVDVVMPRGDYEKLLSLRYNDGRYEIRHFSYTDKYCYTFAKMFDNKTEIIEPWRTDNKSGLYIDIFPMDFVDDNSERTVKTLHRKTAARQFTAYTIPIKPFYFKRINYTVRSCAKLFCYPFKNVLFKRVDTIAKKRTTGKYTVFLLHNEYKRPVIYTADIWDSLIDMDFEDTHFPVFSKYDYVLKEEYGDYMTPPPEEYRHAVHGIEAYYIED